MRPASRREALGAAFFMGLAAAMIQVILIRELLALCRGNELVIGVIFSSWFLGIYLGARFNPPGMDAAMERRVLLSMVLLPLAMIVSVYGAQAVQLLIPRTAGAFYPISAELLLALFFTAPVSFFVGYFFPPLVLLASPEMKERSGGNVFYTESLGSFAGGMAFSFVLVTIANPLAIGSALLSAALCIIILRFDRRLLPLALIPLGLVIFSGAIEERIFSAVWNRTHGGTLVHYQRTKYQSLAIETADGTVSVYGDGIRIYTLPDQYDSRGIFHLINALRQDRRTILLMGSGPGSLLHNLLRSGVSRLYYVDHDPELWDAVYPYRKALYGGENGTGLTVVREDLRHYLSRIKKRFGMIICLAPPPENIMLNRFYTREFFRLCKARLSDDGIFITSLHGFSNYMSPDRRNYIASMYRAFAGEFPNRLRTSGETVYLAGAGPGVLPRSGTDLIRRYAGGLYRSSGPYEKEITENFSPDELRAYFETTQLDYFGKVMHPLLKTVAENRDLQPGAYWRNIVLSAFKEESVLHRLVSGFPMMAAIMAVLTGAVFWDIRRKHGTRRFAAGVVIYATGLVSISVMLVMIVLYQNSHGIVYHRISLINALFMMGLTAGSFTATRWRGMTLPPAMVGIVLAAACVLANTWIGNDLLFWVLLLFFSFLCGAVFPALYAAAGPGTPLDSASVLDAMDHFGAIAGSLLTVMVFLPLLGIRGTIAMNMILVLPAVVISVILRREVARAP